MTNSTGFSLQSPVHPFSPYPHLRHTFCVFPFSTLVALVSELRNAHLEEVVLPA